jgi:hypothetical protein
MATRAKLAATAASLLIANVAEPSSRCRHSHFRRLQPRTAPISAGRRTRPQGQLRVDLTR